MLIYYGINVRLKNNNKDSSILKACRNGHNKCLKIILKSLDTE